MARGRRMVQQRPSRPHSETPWGTGKRRRRSGGRSSPRPMRAASLWSSFPN